MNMTTIYSLTNGLLWNGEFFLGVQWSSRKNQYLPRKKKAYTQTLTKQLHSLFQKTTQRTKNRTVRPGPSSQDTALRQPGTSLIWPVDWVKIGFILSVQSSHAPVTEITVPTLQVRHLWFERYCPRSHGPWGQGWDLCSDQRPSPFSHYSREVAKQS